jgi:hypothetical protein
MSARIEIDLVTKGPAKQIDADTALTVLTSLLEFLRSVRDGDTAGSDFHWYFTELAVGSLHTVGVGELIQAVVPRVKQKTAERRMEAICTRGLRRLNAGAEIPPGFTGQSLTALHKMGAVFGDSVTAIRVSTPQFRRPIRITSRFAANVAKLVGKGLTELGSVEGRLVMVSLARGCAFNVSDEVTGSSVVCRVEEQRLEEVKQALGRRVSVSGEVTYHRSSGEPTEISPVDTIRLLDETTPPKLEEIRRIIPRATPGETAERSTYGD